MPAPLSRKEYIQQQKSVYGRPSVAVLPVHYPKELLTAMEIIGVELWGPPGFIFGAGAARIQPYICAIVRNALSFIEAGKADVVDGIVFPHTCDSLQNLASLIPDFGSWKKPIFRFQHPRGAHRAEASAYLMSEMQLFIDALERAFSRNLSMEKLSWALGLHEKADMLRGELLARRRSFPGSDLELYGILRRGEYLWIEEHIKELRSAVKRLAPSTVQQGIGLLVSGYVPEPMGLLESIRQAGGLIVADDYAAVGRRVCNIKGKSAEHGDPLKQVIERYLSYPPCPTRSLDSAARVAYLQKLFYDAKAEGAIIHGIKFCEPEAFDVPLLKEALQAHRIPVLLLETELEETVSAQISTRIEAFIEMLQTKARPDRQI